MATAQENAGWDCDRETCADKRKQAIREFIAALKSFLTYEKHIFIDLTSKVSEPRRTKFDRRWVALQENPSFSERRKKIRELLSDIHLKSPWRKKVREFRDGKLTFKEAISHRDIRTVLGWGATEARIRDKHDPRWLHYLRDNPPALRKTLETALDSRRLSEGGRRPDWHVTAFAKRIEDIYRHLTGKKLTHSITFPTRSDHDAEDKVPGSGLAFAMACLNFVAPGITLDQTRYRVRKIQQLRYQ